MGSWYSNGYNEYEPKKNFDSILNRQYKPNELHLLNAQLKIMEGKS